MTDTLTPSLDHLDYLAQHTPNARRTLTSARTTTTLDIHFPRTSPEAFLADARAATRRLSRLNILLNIAWALTLVGLILALYLARSADNFPAYIALAVATITLAALQGLDLFPGALIDARSEKISAALRHKHLHASLRYGTSALGDLGGTASDTLLARATDAVTPQVRDQIVAHLREGNSAAAGDIIDTLLDAAETPSPVTRVTACGMQRKRSR